MIGACTHRGMGRPKNLKTDATKRSSVKGSKWNIHSNLKNMNRNIHDQIPQTVYNFWKSKKESASSPIIIHNNEDSSVKCLCLKGAIISLFT